MRPSERPPPISRSLRDEEVADWVESQDRAALLFWDAGDALSQRQRARVEVVAAAAGVPIGVIDIRSDGLVAQAIGVTSVPTLVVFRGGEVVERLIGGAPEAILKQAFDGGHLG